MIYIVVVLCLLNNNSAADELTHFLLLGIPNWQATRTTKGSQ